MDTRANENTADAVEQIFLDSPIGKLVVRAKDNAVYSIGLASRAEEEADRSAVTQGVLHQAAQELNEYFCGTRKTFSFAMRATGTAFQQRVWQRLSAIPFGELRTYGQIAAEVDSPKGSRAVGMACNKNPIMIAVPCHRVVGAGGKLVGFAYGTGMKQQLLDLEQR
jgi:O-6-methylguanine DNA methyltransferase